MQIDCLALPASEFIAIQDKLRLSDAELGAKIFRGPDGPSLVKQYRSGDRPIPDTIAAAMFAFEADSKGFACAA